MLIHDSFSSVGVTLAIARLLLAGARFRYLGRAGSLAEYRREPLAGRERLRNAGRQLAQLPWFARNMAVKLAIVLGPDAAGPLAGTPLRPLAVLT